MKAVVDTNVLLVANAQHEQASPACVEACVARLLALQAEGVVVLDDGFRILDEYQHKTRLQPPKGVGDVFLKWLLRHLGDPRRVETVALVEEAGQMFPAFPDAELQGRFDPSDRKFVAVAAAHPARPPIWQAADSKWLGWWPALARAGVRVEFLCFDDACRFYEAKFHQPPPLPPDTCP